MTKSLFILALLICSFSFGLSAQELSFEEYNPKSTLKVPQNPVSKAKFPFIDIHGHQWRMATQDLSELSAQMDALNMGLMVNLSGGSGKALADAYDNIQKVHADRFLLFANIRLEGIDEPEWDLRTAEQLQRDYEYGARGLKIFKTLGLTAKDKSGNRIAVDDPRLDPVWAKCAELGIPVLIHTADPAPFWEAHDRRQ
jgi:uncharacterized protein